MRRPPPQQRPLPARLLHHLAVVLTVAGRPTARGHSGLAQRRRKQRLELARRLLDPLPEALQPDSRPAERFWSALRWGGGGLLLSWLLRP